jgi:pimeloyl-ACP methyl ester carboxylesterase
MNTQQKHVTVVLVHAAWVDGSSWAQVITPLRQRVGRVIAAPIPMTSLTDDITAVTSIVDRVDGPVILVGHAYSGAVIAGVDHEKVAGLVFVAGLTPQVGETVAEVFFRIEPHALAPKLAPGADGFAWLPETAFAQAFAQHASADMAAIMAATQRPISVQCIQEPIRLTSWTTKPSWYLVAEEDRMIPTETQRFLAQRIGATVRSAPVDHAPMVTAPNLVVEVIEQALASVRGG